MGRAIALRLMCRGTVILSNKQLRALSHYIREDSSLCPLWLITTESTEEAKSHACDLARKIDHNGSVERHIRQNTRPDEIARLPAVIPSDLVRENVLLPKVPVEAAESSAPADNKATTEKTAPRPLIILHGLGRTKLSMLPLVWSAQSAGYDVTNYGYPSRRFTITEQATKLHEFLKERYPPETELNFVAHSMGNIVFRKMAEVYPGEHKIGRVVMLGPPNHGAEIADKLHRYRILAYLIGPALTELAKDFPAPPPASAEIGVIAGGKGTNKGYLPWIKGDNDGLVRIPETHIEGEKEHRVVKVPHTFLMWSPQVKREIFSFLEHGHFIPQS